MTKVEEAFAVLCDVNRQGGVQGHDLPHNDSEWRSCPACGNVRAGFLAAHVEACEAYKAKTHPDGTDEPCGGRWYCERGEEIRKLGR